VNTETLSTPQLAVALDLVEALRSTLDLPRPTVDHITSAISARPIVRTVTHDGGMYGWHEDGPEFARDLAAFLAVLHDRLTSAHTERD
jgi:hypothetical protein